MAAEGQSVGSKSGPVDGLQFRPRVEGGQASESARIAEDQPVPRRVCGKAPDYVEVIFARRLLTCGYKDELAAHAELDEKRRGVAVGDDGELLAAAAQIADEAAFQQAASDAGGCWRVEGEMVKADHVAPGNVHPGHGAADESGGEGAAEMFNLREFGHDGGAVGGI